VMLNRVPLATDLLEPSGKESPVGPDPAGVVPSEGGRSFLNRNSSR